MRDNRRKFKFTFKWGLLAYAVVLIVGILFGLNVFYDFIGDYELSLPSYGTLSTVDIYKTGDASTLINKTELAGVTPYLTEDEILARYNAYIKDKEISVGKAKEYTDESPVFSVKAGKDTVATLYLKKEQKEESSFHNWVYDRVEVKDYLAGILDLADIKVVAPSGSTITINGIAATEVTLVEEKDIEALAQVSKYVSDLPKMATYEVKNIPQDVEVNVSHASLVTKTEKTDAGYVASIVANETTQAEQASYADKAATEWAKKFINVRSSVYNYVYKQSDLYSEMRSTTTGWYPSEYMTGYDFNKKEVSNFIQYSDTCFSCRVEYQIHVTFKNYNVDDTTEDGKFTWYFVKVDGKWLIADIYYE